MAADADVEESAMVTPIHGGRRREVDALISTTVAGHTVRVAVEASKTSRPANVEWVERMIGKHLDLPTDRLVLYSGSGYTPEARRKGIDHNVALIEAEELTEVEATEQVLGRLQTIWPKLLRFDVLGARIGLRAESELVWRSAPAGTHLFLEDGTLLDIRLRDALIIGLSSERAMQEHERQLDMRNIAESTIVNGTVTVPMHFERAGEQHELYVELENDGDKSLVKVETFEAELRFNIEVIAGVDLQHARLGDVRVAFGEWKAPSGQGTIVISASEHHEETLTMRLPDGRESTVLGMASVGPVDGPKQVEDSAVEDAAEPAPLDPQ
jgi:hypothetical protein